MKKFGELYEKNAIISGALAIILVSVVCVMAIRGQEIPVLIGSLTGGACGYYLGAGKATATIQAIKGK